MSLKEEVERRYGSKLNFLKLGLFDRAGTKVADLEEDFRTLNYYGVQDGYNVYIKDTNPHSIHKEIEDLDKVQKYKISEEDYGKLPESFRKWRKKYHPKAGKECDPAMFDPEYMKAEAEAVPLGHRCRTPDGHRGVVAYVGKIPDLGVGYFVGIVLD
jgi:tubulin-folding cofactor B